MTRVTDLIEPDSLLVLTGYEPVPDAPPAPDDRFVSAFRELGERRPRTEGLVHRVLYQRVLAWNEKVAAEMQQRREGIAGLMGTAAVLGASLTPALAVPLAPPEPIPAAT